MSSPEPEVRQHPRTPTVVITGAGVPVDRLPAFFDTAFTALGTAIGAGEFTPVGPAFAQYLSPPAEVVDLAVGFPVRPPVGDLSSAQSGELHEGPVATMVHEGSFDGLGDSWARLTTWVHEQGLTPAQGVPFWEVYLTEPSPEMDPAALRTALYLPLAP